MNTISLIKGGKLTFALLTLSQLLSHSASASSWSPSNSPNILMRDYVTDFSTLPLEKSVSVEKMPWSDTYWPSKYAAIAYRWNSNDPRYTWQNPLNHDLPPETFIRQFPSKAQALKMTAAEIDDLSPSEKYDLFNADYNEGGWFSGGFSLTRKVMKKHRSYMAYWAGICHGWAPASIIYREPANVTVTNKDGIKINFYSADVKALLSWYYANEKSPSHQLGLRCGSDLKLNPDDSTTEKCADVNAGSLHIVLGNLIGLRNQSFVGEISRDIEVWNNAIYGYESQTVGTSAPTSKSAKGTVTRLQVKTTIHFADDDESRGPEKNPNVGTMNYKSDKLDYEYFLELNAQGQIIGGEWISFDRPDFLWTREAMPFDGDFKALGNIYRPAELPANPVPGQATEKPAPAGE